jgi:aminopeptidase N
MEWTDSIFGRYVYPQITNLHRIESGGTEFPMLIMDGSASEGLIVHEILHQYAHAILANNEWRDGWLDEGLTSFLTNWYWEARGQQGVWERTLQAARERERRGLTQPIATPGAEFVDFATYQAMTYTRPSLVFRMLRETVGHDTMIRILRTYYEQNKLQHVDEHDFRRAVNQVTGQNYDWFFDQWLHTVATLDYAITSARTQRLGDGRWRTQVEVTRAGDAWMPVTLQVGEVRRTLDSRERRQVVEIVTEQHPAEAVLDPEQVLLDVDPTTHRRTIS